MKNLKTFYESQTASRFREFFSLLSTHPSPFKNLLRLWNKYFLTQIYRNTQTFAFKVPKECSSWTSRNGAVQTFYLTPDRNMFAGKFVKSEKLLTVLREHAIFNVN